MSVNLDVAADVAGCPQHAVRQLTWGATGWPELNDGYAYHDVYRGLLWEVVGGWGGAGQ